MYSIGITGGIGSGKSLVSIILKSISYPVYDADARAKWLSNHHPQVREQLFVTFGENVFDGQGTLNRIWLAQQVFSNPEKLKLLNQIVHPVTIADFEDWKREQSELGKILIFKEAAILYEAGANSGVDSVWVVYAPQRIRIQRIKTRDSLSEAEIYLRINRQIPDSEKIYRADFTIYNDGKSLILPQIYDALQIEFQKITGNQ
ncbi:MAG: dephospho-CoA kinase [Bacteroidia bacterium]|nr:dephospho-CoA kinase [Bacteroidia bacterium]